MHWAAKYLVKQAMLKQADPPEPATMKAQPAPNPMGGGGGVRPKPAAPVPGSALDYNREVVRAQMAAQRRLTGPVDPRIEAASFYGGPGQPSTFDAFNKVMGQQPLYSGGGNAPPKPAAPVPGSALDYNAGHAPRNNSQQSPLPAR